MAKRILNVLIIFGLMAIPKISFACCNCCACNPCVAIALQTSKAATSTAFQTLGAGMTAFEEVIEVGIESVNQMIDLQGGNIIATIQGVGTSYGMESKRYTDIHVEVIEAYAKSQERLFKSSSIAKNNLYSATSTGYNSVPRQAKVALTYQKMVMDGDSKQLTVSTMKGLVDQRQQALMEQVFPLESKTSHERYEAAQVSASQDITRYLSAPMIPKELMRNLAGVVNLMVVPPLVERRLSGIEQTKGDWSGSRNVVERVRIAADFMAWDMALRSQIDLEAGDWSFLMYLKANIDQSYENANSIDGEINASARELLQVISLGRNLDNLISMLTLDAQRHSQMLDTALIGFDVDVSYHGNYGETDAEHLKSLDGVTN